MSTNWKTTIYFLQGIVGLIANILVVVVIFKTPQLLKSDSIRLIANQSLIDGTISLCLLFSYVNLHNFGIQFAFTDGNVSDQLLCFFYIFDRPLWGFLVSSTANLLLMTIVKYLQIVYPLWYRTKFSPAKLWVGIIIAWVVGPFYACVVFSNRVKVVDNQCNLSAWSNRTLGQFIGVLTILLQFFLPVAILIFCYTHMLLIIKKRWSSIMPAASSNQGENLHPQQVTQVSTIAVSENKNGPNNQSGDTIVTLHPPTLPNNQSKTTRQNSNLNSTNKKRQQEDVPPSNSQRNMRIQRNIVITLLLVSLGFIFCWVWRCTQFLLENLGIQDATKNYGTFMHQFGTLAIFTNSVLNPFVYIISFKNFRKAARELFLGR